MVDLSILTNSVRVHPGVKTNLHERNELRKNKPDVNHLDIGSGWKARGHADEEGSKDQQGGQIDSDNSFKEEIFKEVCSVDNCKDKYSWEIYCESCVVYSSLEYCFNVKAF